MVNKLGSWKNEAHVEMAQKLHREGLSASQIATKLNRTFKDADYSRNAVIGKLSRMGMTTSPQARQATNVFKNRQNMRGAQSGLRAPPVDRNRHNGGIHMKAAKIKAAAPAAKAMLAIAGNGVVYERSPEGPDLPRERFEPAGLATPLTLGPHMCKWPIGDPQHPTFTFCGQNTGAIYCEAHAARAYEPPKPRAPKAAKDLMRSLRRYMAA